MKSTVDQKCDLFYSLRKENKPPLCWHLIYSAFTGKNTISNIQKEVIGLNTAIKSLKSNNITQGENILKFENALKKFFGSKYSTVVSSGTAALEIAMKSLNINKNSEVIK